MLVDDHPVVRAGIRYLLEVRGAMQVVGEASTAAEALELLANTTAQVAILDINLPDMDGIALAQAIAQKRPQLRLVALSMNQDLEYVKGFLAAGGLAYVPKASVDNELLDAVKQAAEGRRYLSNALAMQLVMNMVQDETLPEANLSAREQEVLRRLAQGHTHQEIGQALDISEKTVATYRARAFEKLGLKSRSELLRYALRQGWLDD